MASVSKQAAPRPTPNRSPRSAGASPRGPSDKTAWQVNWRLLIGTLLVVAGVAPIAYFWHSYQVKRNAAIFLARADDVERDGQWADAVKYIDRYLKIYPGDVGVRVRLAQAFDHLADESPRRIPAAERLYSIAIGLSPDRADLRCRHAERLMELGRFHDAKAEIKEALEREPGDARSAWSEGQRRLCRRPRKGGFF